MPDNADIVAMVQEAMADTNPEAVIYTWQTMLVPFLPIAEALLESKAISDAGRDCGLTVDEVYSAIALLAQVKRCEDPHRAWLAAEIVMNFCPNREHLIAALMTQDAAKREEKAHATGNPPTEAHVGSG